jgi:hypothetical protein
MTRRWQPTPSTWDLLHCRIGQYLYQERRRWTSLARSATPARDRLRPPVTGTRSQGSGHFREEVIRYVNPAADIVLVHDGFVDGSGWTASGTGPAGRLRGWVRLDGFGDGSGWPAVCDLLTRDGHHVAGV